MAAVIVPVAVGAHFGGAGVGGAVNHEITQLDNGIAIDITSDDSKVVEKIQSKKPHAPKDDSVSVSSENLDNGVRVTITSDDADVVEKIQSRSSKGPRGMRRGGRMHPFAGQIEHNVTKIDDGVVIEITTENTEALEVLRSEDSRFSKMPEHENIDVVREVIDNGLRLIITSEDEALVEKIQTHSEKGPHMMRR